MIETKKQLPSPTLTVTIGSNDYVIKFPNNGQLIDIETVKISLSRDNINSLMTGGSISSDIAFLTIQAIATFNILIPELKNDLNKPLLELSLIETKPLIKAYTNQFYPWFSAWIKEINKDEDAN